MILLNTFVSSFWAFLLSIQIKLLPKHVIWFLCPNDSTLINDLAVVTQYEWRWMTHSPYTFCGTGTAPSTVCGTGTAPSIVCGTDTDSSTICGTDTAPYTVCGTDTAPSTVCGTDTDSSTVLGTDTAPSTVCGTDTDSSTVCGTDTAPSTVCGIGQGSRMKENSRCRGFLGWNGSQTESQGLGWEQVWSRRPWKTPQVYTI